MLAAARDGHGRVCVIDGPSGVGKSRLLDACADSAAALGMSVLRARCSELTRDYPFGAARTLFEGPLMRCGEQAVAQFMGGPAALSEPVFGRGAAANETPHYGHYWLTLNMAEQRPIAMLIDDVPWADDLSLRFLAYLAEKLDNAHVALVVVVRTGDPGAESELVGHLWESASVPTIRPAELSESAVADLLAAALPGHEVDPDLLQTVFEDTRGNPLLVVAVADAIAGWGRHRPDDPRIGTPTHRTAPRTIASGPPPVRQGSIRSRRQRCVR